MLPLNVDWIAIECCHWIAIEYSLNCHWMFIELPLNVHWIAIECCHWIATDCSLNCHWMIIELPLNVDLIELPLNIHWIAIDCSFNCHWMFIEICYIWLAIMSPFRTECCYQLTACVGIKQKCYQNINHNTLPFSHNLSNEVIIPTYSRNPKDISICSYIRNKSYNRSLIV